MKLLLFENVHRVMRAEQLLLAAGVPCELLPTPQHISRECGMCIGVENVRLPAAERALAGVAHRVADAPRREEIA
ncbi:MAG: DUF3343 domain-containing protein [Polyangia bacterium]